jgi:hypothetical protein
MQSFRQFSWFHLQRPCQSRDLKNRYIPFAALDFVAADVDGKLIREFCDVRSDA